MERGGCVYIMMSYSNTALYIGVTSDLLSRVEEHRSGMGSKFTAKYNCKKVVFYEFHPNISEAIAREKQLKRWHREWEFNLIKESNPELKDLYRKLVEK